MASNRKRTYSSASLGAEQTSNTATNFTSPLKKQKVRDEISTEPPGSPLDNETLRVVFAGVTGICEMSPEDVRKVAIGHMKRNAESASMAKPSSTQANGTTKRDGESASLNYETPSQAFTTAKRTRLDGEHSTLASPALDATPSSSSSVILRSKPSGSQNQILATTTSSAFALPSISKPLLKNENTAGTPTQRKRRFIIDELDKGANLSTNHPAHQKFVFTTNDNRVIANRGYKPSSLKIPIKTATPKRNRGFAIDRLDKGNNLPTENGTTRTTVDHNGCIIATRVTETISSQTTSKKAAPIRKRSISNADLLDDKNFLPTHAPTSKRQKVKIADDEENTIAMSDAEATAVTIAKEPLFKLTDFPAEILEVVASKAGLDAGDAASLALSCRYLFRIVGTSPWDMLRRTNAVAGRFNRALHLLSYERDLPNKLTCLACLRHHEWKHLPDDKVTGLPLQKKIGACQRHDGGHRFCKHFTLNTTLVRLVLRAKAISPDFGIPVERISHHCYYKTRYGFLFNKVEPKFVNGRLLIKESHRIPIKLQDNDTSKHVLEQLKKLPRICTHEDQYDSLQALCCCAISHLASKQNHRKALQEAAQPKATSLLELTVQQYIRTTPVSRLRQDIDRMNRDLFLRRRCRTPTYGTHALIGGVRRKNLRRQLTEAAEPARRKAAAEDPRTTIPAETSLHMLRPRIDQRHWNEFIDPARKNSSQPPKDNWAPRSVDEFPCPLCRDKPPGFKCHLCTRAEAAKNQVPLLPICGRCVAPRRCLFCPTEFDVRARKTQHGQLELEVVAYKDYGDDPNPLSFEIVSHSTERCAEVDDKFDPRSPYMYRWGSLRALWESNGGGNGMEMEKVLLQVLQDARLTPNVTRYV